MFRTTLALLLLAACASASCAPEPRSATWFFRFEDPTLHSASRAVEARIVEGNCDGTAVRYEASLGVGTAASLPPELAPGPYALIGRSRDALCAYHATGCTPVTFPAPDGTRFEVILRADTSGARACDLDHCEDGRCTTTTIDAGPSDAAFDAGTDTGPIDAGCTDRPTCDDDHFIHCSERITCPAGCAPEGDLLAQCRTLVPSNVATAVALDAGTADVVLAEDDTFFVANTDDGWIGTPSGDIVIRPAGDGDIGGIVFARVPVGGGLHLGVFAMRSLTIEVGTSLSGRGTRALVLLVADSAQIDGVISVTADFVTDVEGPGPGGGAGGPPGMSGVGNGGGAAGTDSSGQESGGGGASFGARGGTGGAEPGVLEGVPGATYGGTGLVPLFGGSGGGGGGDVDDGGRGGHGAGALQISVGGTFTLGADGRIGANGGGGQGGQSSAGNSGGGGGGGGGGGAILIEAVDMNVIGHIGASGGGGGQGGVDTATSGADGGRGASTITSVPAPGGGTDTSAAGAGGHGSNREAIAGNGGDRENGGGGGGGAGRIRLNAIRMTIADVFSPRPVTGLTTFGAPSLTPP
jgi:hypothetical protein